MLDDNVATRYLRETHALAQAVTAVACPPAAEPSRPCAPIDPRGQLRRCLRAYIDSLLESRSGFLFLPGGKPAVLSGDDTSEEFALHQLRRTITERFIVCASGSDRTATLAPLVEGWLALAESMFADWARSGTPDREDLENVICDLFFAAIDAADFR